MWVTITTSLNSVGFGPQKTPKEWQKVFIKEIVCY